jgi:hypothetical protein
MLSPFVSQQNMFQLHNVSYRPCKWMDKHTPADNVYI